jgi:hypothetical protein
MTMGQPGPWELRMASITNLIRGTGREDFDLFERAGGNVEHAGELLDEMLAGFPDTWGLARDTTRQFATAAEEGRDLAIGPAVATRSSDTDDVCGPGWPQAQWLKPRWL